MRLASLLLLSLLTACASHARCELPVTVQVPTAPPAPLDEPDSKAAIAPGMTWIAGHWHWDGYRWLWLTGRWASTPAGQRWVKARYRDDNSEHFYRPGAFSCADGDDE